MAPASTEGQLENNAHGTATAKLRREAWRIVPGLQVSEAPLSFAHWGVPQGGWDSAGLQPDSTQG